MPKDLNSNTLWWNGPEYLKFPQSEWPIKDFQLSSISVIEKKSIETFTTTVEQPCELIERFGNSFTKLVCVTAYCLRYISKLKNKTHEPGSPCARYLTKTERSNSLIRLIKLVQRQTFNHEIRTINNNKPLDHKSQVKNLSPFLDKDGLLRVGGRIKNAHMTFDQRHQILLPKGHHFTTLIFRHEHQKHFHCGPQNLLAQMRQRYWPIHGKSEAKRIVHQCVICFKRKPTPLHQLMGDLPSDRLNPVIRAFDVVGVDYCGPFLTKNQCLRSTAHYKTYVAVFICFSTKAMHLETVSDLTSQAFIACLHRFVARRGRPAIIHSDNGTNFVGSVTELDKLHSFFTKQSTYESIQNFCDSENIIWKFIPPRAPHFGGLWEAGVKAVKYHLKRVTKDQPMSFEELSTLITQIEGCLNSRPLTPLSDDPNDLSPLTPAHFIIGAPITSIAEPNIQDMQMNRLSPWKRIQQMKQSFWTSWSTEYINTLQTRIKWNSQKPNIQLNDLVIVKQDNLPPTSWMMGRVIQLHTGADNNVRVVSLKTKAGITKRPITRVCPLPKEGTKQSVESGVSTPAGMLIAQPPTKG